MAEIEGITELLAAARAGNPRAESVLFSALRARILSVVQRRVWGYDLAAGEPEKEAEDLTSDVMLTILHKYKAVDLEHGFLPWVFEIVRHKIGDWIRGRERRHRYLEPESNPGFGDHPATLPDPYQESWNREIRLMLERAIVRIEARHRPILQALLRDDIGSYRVARIQSGTPRNTVDSEVFRCRERLKELLRQEGYQGWPA